MALPKTVDDAVQVAEKRASDANLTPAEYEQATREAAAAYLAAPGPHAADAPTTPMPADAAAQQTADFLPQLWGVEAIAAVPQASRDDPTRVLATVYEIGGPLTGVLSTSVAKTLPLIPHVGIRAHGVEYFYSDHIEYRTVPVMEEMLGERPQVTLDLGPATMSADEIADTVARLDSQWSAADYHVFDKNCVHFAVLLAATATASGIPAELSRGILDISERMLDSLPEWRRSLGRRVMNEVTRLVVVSWGRASSGKKSSVADSLGLDRGA